MLPRRVCTVAEAPAPEGAPDGQTQKDPVGRAAAPDPANEDEEAAPAERAAATGLPTRREATVAVRAAKAAVREAKAAMPEAQVETAAGRRR